MSIEAMIWVRKHAPVENATEMCILYSLADRANDDGTGCWPSNETIADEARCSPRTVKRHMKELASRGLIVPGDERMVASYRPDRRPNVWDLNMSLGRDDTGCQNDTPNKSGVSSGAQRGDNGGNHGVSSGAQRGDTGDTQTIHNPPIEPPVNHPPLAPQGADGASAAEGDPAMARFQEFYDVYGRKKKRPDAERAWKKAVKKADPQVIIDSAARFVAAQKSAGKHPQYTPYPASWLNGEQWNDEVDDHQATQSSPSNDFDDWMPPIQPAAPQLPSDADLFNTNVIDHQETY